MQADDSAANLIHRRALLLGLGALGCTRPSVLPVVSGPTPGPVLPASPMIAQASSAFIRGVNYAHLHVEGHGYGSSRSWDWLGRLVDHGVTDVALMPFAYMPEIDKPDLRFGGDRTLDDAALLAEAAQARAAGLRVMFKPHLWAPPFGRGAFPGDIEMDSPESWKRWFSAYTDYALLIATAAEQAGASLFCVGNECTRASLLNPGAWAEVAAAVRRVYRGPLVYGANWNDEVFGFHDWAAFDHIGVNAYFPLSDAASPSVEALIAGWQGPLARLSGLAASTGRSVIFTEAGYEALAGAAARPWGSGTSSADPALQSRAYEALMRAVGPQPWFQGIYWWKWFTDGPDNPWDRSAYCPEPEALTLMERWFGGG